MHTILNTCVHACETSDAFANTTKKIRKGSDAKTGKKRETNNTQIQGRTKEWRDVTHSAYDIIYLALLLASFEMLDKYRTRRTQSEHYVLLVKNTHDFSDVKLLDLHITNSLCN